MSTVSKRFNEFVGKRAEEAGKRSYEFLGKRNRYEFIGKRPYEFLGKRNVYEFLGKRNPYEILGKRNPYEFLGKRNPYEFLSKRNPYEFIGKRNPYEFIGKRNPYEFIGKRNPYEFIGKRNPAYEFLGKRNMYEFLGKRDNDLAQRPFSATNKRALVDIHGKRVELPYEFVGKRVTGSAWESVEEQSLLKDQLAAGMGQNVDKRMGQAEVDDIKSRSKRYSEWLGKRGVDTPKQLFQELANKGLSPMVLDYAQNGVTPDFRSHNRRGLRKRYTEFVGK